MTAKTQFKNAYLLEREAEYIAWRDAKLADYPRSAAELVVQIEDATRLREEERRQLLQCVRKSNFVIYQLSDTQQSSKDVIRAFGQQLGLMRLDSNLCADEDSISSLQVVPGKLLRGYIPYSNRRLNWHTDGYYNAAEQSIHAMLLHCVQDASTGGENLLLDHEICYIHLRDRNPDYIRALMQPQAMTIPPNNEGGEEVRGALSGPVFSLDAHSGQLLMRYTARTRSIEWHDDPMTREASECIRDFLASDSPYIFRHRLIAGQGVLSNNILHARTAFEDGGADGKNRLLFRARYYDRISDR